MAHSRLLVLGVNGFLGPAIVAAAAARGIEAVGLSRSQAPSRPMPCRYVSGDRTSPECVRDLVRRHRIDAVVDVIALTLADAQPVIEQRGETRYVLLSSNDVYRNYELLHRRATGTPVRGHVDEECALRATRFPYRGDSPRGTDDPDRWLDDYDKIPIEEAVRAGARSWTILRLPMVYGRGDPHRRFRWAIQHMSRTGEPLVIPRGLAAWQVTYGDVGNIADAIVLSATRPEAECRIYNVGEERAVDHLTWAHRVAEAMEWRGAIEVGDADSGSTPGSGLDFSVPLTASTARIRDELGFAESIGRRDALLEAIADEQARA